LNERVANSETHPVHGVIRGVKNSGVGIIVNQISVKISKR